MSIIFMLIGAALLYKGLKMPFIKTNKSFREFGADLLEADANKAVGTGFKTAFRIYAKVLCVGFGIGFLGLGFLAWLF